MKKAIGILVTVFCLLSLSTTAFAEHFSGNNWSVTYKTDGSLKPGYREDEQHDINYEEKNIIFSDYLRDLQPGDDLELTVTLSHENSQRADWYMTNDVFKSLEDRSSSGSSGGAYTYILKYEGPNQERELYNSDTVGGDGSEQAEVGLREATNALKDDYIYLDSLGPGQTAKVKLYVALDGESQGNRYQDTKAFLQMNFAVEQRDRRVVMTGDDTNLTPLYVVALLSGIGVLILAIRDLRARKQGNHVKSTKRRSEV